jgi:hypothetical protein
MLNWLNKPWIAIPLAGGAILFVLYRFIPEDWDKRLGQGEQKLVQTVEKTEAKLIPNLRLLQAIPAKLHEDWDQPLRKNKLERKLFPEIEPEVAIELRETYDLPRGTVLQAVVLEGQRRAAVISGQTYLEGEAYGNFRVAKIHRDWVLLTHAGGGREILRVGGLPGEFSRAPSERAGSRTPAPRSP